jgi:hypothetical protein
VTIANQASYIAGWLRKFREDRKLLVHAARSSDVANGVDNIAARGHHRRYQTAAPAY